MRSLVSRLKRLEQAQRMRVGPRRIRIEPGYLKTLPSDYVGPRHQITVRQIPPEELPPAHRAENWFEWEERPGLGPEPQSSGRDDEMVVQVQYVESAGLAGVAAHEARVTHAPD